MIVEKLLHNFFAILFPLVLKDHTAEVNYSSYWRYTATMFLMGLMIANNKFIANKNGSFWKSYNIVSQNGLLFVCLWMVGTTFMHIEEYKSSSAFIFAVILFYLYGVYFRQFIKKTGLSDFIFTIFITQMLLSLSEEIAYQEFSFKTMALFSPINLLCFTVQITFHGYINETTARREKMTPEQQSFLSAYKILGKEDSFRLMIMIFLYIWSFLLIGFYVQQSKYSRPLIPVIMVTPSFYSFLASFKRQQFDNAFYESRRCYTVFSFAYMMIHILSFVI